MEKELNIAYKLYAMSADKEGLEVAAEQRFARITPFYVLVYTSEKEPDNSVEITTSETHRLSPQDEQWLQDCNFIILAEEAKKHEAEIAADMMERLTKLEEALEAEQKKQEE